MKNGETMSSPPIRRAQNYFLGRHFVATRPIQPDELILRVNSVCAFPWALDKSTIICLSCYKILDLKTANLCQHCNWPVCNSTCAQGKNHADFECRILQRNQIEFNIAEPGLSYFCVQTLRCLLLADADPVGFQAVLDMEAHISNRDQIPEIANEIAYVIDFIHNKCHNEFLQFDQSVIKQIFGATEINTFTYTWNSFSKRSTDLDQNRGCIVFPEVSICSHDCSPNSVFEISRVPQILNGHQKQSKSASESDSEIQQENIEDLFQMKVKAKRLIQDGENITISYGGNSSPVKERREKLKQLYFFDCACDRCKLELAES